MRNRGLDILFLKLNLNLSFNNFVSSFIFIIKPFEFVYNILAFLNIFIMFGFSINPTVYFSKFLEFLICASFLESGQFVYSAHAVGRRL